MYCDKLPRKIKGKKCLALLDNGERCPKSAIAEVAYHGDKGWFPPMPTWVRIFVCIDHIEDIDRETLKI